MRLASCTVALLGAFVTGTTACRDSSAPAANTSPTQAVVRDVVGFGGTWGLARGINDVGRVVGEASVGVNRSHAFSWSELGGVRDLGTLGGSLSAAHAINFRGQIVGWATTATEIPHAFLVTVGQPNLRDLGVPAGGVASFASDVNDDGTVVGHWVTQGSEFRAFTWTDADGMRDLAGVSGFAHTEATSINASGQVVGIGTTASGSVRALVWSAGVGTEVGTLPGHTESVAWGINSLGHIVGSSRNGAGPQHAFRFTSSGGMRDLGVLPGMDWSIARDVSDNGLVVGVSGRTGSDVGQAFVWTEQAGMRALAGLSGADRVETAALAINLDGRSVGYSWSGTSYRPVIFPAPQ
jgi:probable HAF family extracellular repeat protein